MAGEDEAGENVERAPRAERPAFGRRAGAVPSSGKLARAAAAAGRAEDALRAAADLKPRGLSWGLVLCIAATVVLGLLALINRPQIDDDAAYYVAAGVLIFVALMLERRSWLRLSDWRFLIVLALVVAVAFPVLVHVHWLASYGLWSLASSDLGPADPTVDDLLSFQHRWCTSWTDNRYHCSRQNPDPDIDRQHWEEVTNGHVTCVRSLGWDRPSMRRVKCLEASVPAWCTRWWNGSSAVDNPGPKHRFERTINDPLDAPSPPKERAAGSCIDTIWKL